MRITVIDEQTGEVHAVEQPQKAPKKASLVIDSEAKPEKLPEEPAAEKPASWKEVQFKDGRVIEINTESGEIVGND